jgi:hypothetical protein
MRELLLVSEDAALLERRVSRGFAGCRIMGNVVMTAVA